MPKPPSTPDGSVDRLSEPAKTVVSQLRRLLRQNLPKGFEEVMSYGMIGNVVPHPLYPAGYHCNPKLPLPFINLAAQKNYVSLYHMGLVEGPLLDWFKERWQAATPAKLDLGKSCLRLRDPARIPFDLIAELAKKMTPKQW